MNFQTIEVTREGAFACVILNRPEVRNAFNDIAIAELIGAFRALGADEGTRVITLSARGPAFSAGGDLNWMHKMAGYSHAENLADAGQLASMLHTIEQCPKPVVAKVQGDCYGGGVGLISVCDIVIAAETACFCLPEVKLGLIPATISPYVIRAMGASAARRYFLTAERFSAQEARRIGLVHEAVVDSKMDAAVDGIVAALSAGGAHALQETKRLVRDMAGAPITEDLIADTVNRIADIRAGEEGREGVKAFLEKRKPSWSISE